ncbi:unannotated protein [freshwater metagenome]|uniref:Unannotated protein n=1 Tax=freshwater metagenome TaxID=449393 RepID=A0A6J6XQ48_9ZZZZ
MPPSRFRTAEFPVPLRMRCPVALGRRRRSRPSSSNLAAATRAGINGAAALTGSGCDPSGVCAAGLPFAAFSWGSLTFRSLTFGVLTLGVLTFASLTWGSSATLRLFTLGDFLEASCAEFFFSESFLECFLFLELLATGSPISCDLKIGSNDTHNRVPCHLKALFAQRTG